MSYAKRWIFVVLSCLAAACSNPERSEAVRFCRLLQQQQKLSTTLSNEEVSLLAAIKKWDTDVIILGSFYYDDEIAKVVPYVGQLSTLRMKLLELRTPFEAEPLAEASTQTVRSSIVTSISDRVEFLAELQVLVQENTRSTSAGELAKQAAALSAKLQIYNAPTDIVGSSLKEIRTKFDVTDQELGPR